MVATAIVFGVLTTEGTPSSQAAADIPRASVSFEGTVSGSENYVRQFGPDFEFRLNAKGGYWRWASIDAAGKRTLRK